MVRKKSVRPLAVALSRTFRGVRSWTFMRPLIDWWKASRHLILTACRVLSDLLRLVAGMFRSRTAVEAENLFLRKQLALFQERKAKASRADDATRWLMGFLSCWFAGARLWSMSGRTR